MFIRNFLRRFDPFRQKGFSNATASAQKAVRPKKWKSNPVSMLEKGRHEQEQQGSWSWDKSRYRTFWIPPAVLALAVSGGLGGWSKAFGERPVDPPSMPGAPIDQASTESLEKAAKTTMSPKKKRLLILGTGWAGHGVLKELDTALYDVVVVSPRNYFLFTPLLPGVTTGSVEARSISEPIRRIIFRNRKEAQYVEAEVTFIDPEQKRVRCQGATPLVLEGKEVFDLDYDYLVLAVGACVNTFNTPGVTENCHFLKEVKDAERIRESVVDCFERASLPLATEEEKRQLLRFVVVGGGPTGVEFSAELHDLICHDLVKLYPGQADLATVTVIQSGDHILNMFDKRISEFASKKFARDGVTVRTGARVTLVTPKHICFTEKWSGREERCEYGLIVWSTGIGTLPVVADLMTRVGQADRRAVAVDEWLRVKGCLDVWALGDCATVESRPMRDDISLLFKMADRDNDGLLSPAEFEVVLQSVRARYPQIDLYLNRKTFQELLQGKGGAPRAHFSVTEFEEALGKVDLQMKSLPATAQVAAQQGSYLAHCFNRLQDADATAEGPLRMRGTGRHRFKPFGYRHLGQFAPLGGGQAGAELPGDWVHSGRSSQWLWYSVYARNRNINRWELRQGAQQ